MNSSVRQDDDRRRLRRRVGALGGLVLAAGYVGGAFVAVSHVENNLTDKVQNQLAARGVADAKVTFSGQDGTVKCATGLADSAAIKAEAEKLYGVRVLKLDASCLSAPPAPAPVDTAAPTPATEAAPAATEPPATAAAVAVSITPVATVADGKITLTGEVASDAQKQQLVDAATAAYGAANVTDQLTVAADSGDTGTSDPLAAGLVDLIAAMPNQFVTGSAGVAQDALYIKGDAANAADALEALKAAAASAGAKEGDITLTAAANDALVSAATLQDGKITLTGTVSSEAQKQALADAAAKVVDPGNIINNIVVDPSLNLDQANVDGLATLIGAMPPNLVSGESGFDGTKLYAKGVYVSDETKAAFEAAAASVGVTPTLEARPEGTADTAAALQQQLNDFVAANPILFESGKAVLTPEANIILDQVASFAKQLGGVAIEVQGHTDDVGSPANNLALSQNRAAAVVQALVARGVPAEQLTPKGFGEDQPKVPNDSPANQAINRRVEFAVSAN